ncbi:MAG: hypothetical protein VX672_03720 [Planctomycetota bacterium]|nr:hypothetical protein [Planctomycetota bacterium]
MREWISEHKEGIANVTVVTLVTLLIWTWAAGETRETEPSFVDLELVSPTEGSLQFSPPRIPAVRLMIRGPRRAVEAASDRLREPVAITAGTLGVPAEPGEYDLDLARIATDLLESWRLPVTVIDADPPMARVEVEALSQRRSRIVPILPASARTTGRLEIEPESATVVLPNAIEGLDDLEVEARITERDLEGRQPGRRHQFQVTLQLPESLAEVAENARIEPPIAEVRLTLDSNDEDLELTAPVPVQIAGPAVDLEDWSVEIDPATAFLRKVVLRGPADEIQRLRDREGGLGVIAFVHLTGDDLLKMVEEKPVTLWSLPPGIEVTSVDGDATSSPRIAVRIQRRDATP